MVCAMKDTTRTDTENRPSLGARAKSRSDQVTAGIDAGFLGNVMKLLEWGVALILVVLTAWGVLALGALVLVSMWQHALTIDATLYIEIIDATLVVFIVVELFRVAVSYVQHKDVIPTVMEAALVAVARKVLVIDPSLHGQELMFKSVGLGFLVISIGATWYLLRRSGVGLDSGEADWLKRAVGGRATELDAPDDAAPESA